MTVNNFIEYVKSNNVPGDTPIFIIGSCECGYSGGMGLLDNIQYVDGNIFGVVDLEDEYGRNVSTKKVDKSAAHFS